MNAMAEDRGASRKGRRWLRAALVVGGAVWIGLYAHALIVDGAAPAVTIHGQVRRFDGPLEGVGTRCRNLPTLASEFVAVYDGHGELLGRAWVRHVERLDTNAGDRWTCRQTGDFSVRVRGADEYRVELDGVPVQPPKFSGFALRSDGGAYSLEFGLLDPSDGDRAVGCFSTLAAACAL
jgi:hypothetical protein